MLPGAIYDQATVKALRYHARAYLHGHTVGGTNPSLVEALAAGNMVIAHDNPYNRWTAGAAAIFGVLFLIGLAALTISALHLRIRTRVWRTAPVQQA